MTAESLIRLIQSRYDRLTATEMRVADLLLASPHLMNGFTATELAAAAKVSKATITRFISKLGLASFDEFRRVRREREPPSPGSPLQLMDSELTVTAGDLQALVSQTLSADTDNLRQTYADLSLVELAEAVDLLATARSVAFADFRKQFALAYYASTLFETVRPRVRTLPPLGASAVDGVLDLGADDLVIMFPFRRPQRDQDILSKAVLNAGSTLITIGDVWPNPANQRARIHFRCRTESAGVFDSFVTPMSLINVLFTATANHLGETAADRLALLEDNHHLFQTFSARRDDSDRGGRA